MTDFDPALTLHMRRMETGSERLIHAIRVARGEVSHAREKKRFAVGDDLIWSYVIPDAPPKVIHGRYAAEAAEWMQRSVTKHETKRAFADTLRVSRDPCPMCGVRGDVGCKHKRLAA